MLWEASTEGPARSVASWVTSRSSAVISSVAFSMALQAMPTPQLQQLQQVLTSAVLRAAVLPPISQLEINARLLYPPKSARQSALWASASSTAYMTRPKPSDNSFMSELLVW